MITVEELYESASNSKDLSLTSDKRTDADVLIAAGWSDSLIGMALLRLHSEWEGAEKPRKPQTKEEGIWYENELAMLRMKLKTLPQVMPHLLARAEKRRFPKEAIGPVLAWWLDQSCRSCDGHGKTKIPGTPALSAHNCQACNGSGKRQIPYRSIGKAIACDFDDLVNRGRQSLSRRLKQFHH